MQKKLSPLIKSKLIPLLLKNTDIELAILVGSQATGNTNEHSDWDIAIRWIKKIDPLQQLAETEILRRLIAKKLNESESKIDLINLLSANLTMRALVSEEGLILKGENSLAWNYFLQRTWRDLEDFYWEDIYAT